MRYLPILLAAFALVAAAPGLAAAQTPAPAAVSTNGVTMAETRDWLIGLGGTVAEPEARAGAQVLRVADDPLPWNLSFYGCTALCDDLQYIAVFTGPVTLEQVNAWNLNNRYLKAAYAAPATAGAEPSIVVQYDLILTATGTAQLQEPTVIWLQQLRAFAQLLTQQAGEAAAPSAQ